MLYIDRCVCVGCPFTELKKLAREQSLDFDGLARSTGCGDGCGLCRPYIKAMLRTGQTVFTELICEPEPVRPEPGRPTKPPSASQRHQRPVEEVA